MPRSASPPPCHASGPSRLSPCDVRDGRFSASRRSYRDYEGRGERSKDRYDDRYGRHRDETRYYEDRGGPRYDRERQQTRGNWDWTAPARNRPSSSDMIRSSRSNREKGSDCYERTSRQSSSPDFERKRRSERARYDENTVHTNAGAETPGGRDEVEDAPDFQPSGLLAKESNQVNGTALKYHEPSEAKRPKKKWRLYVFKGGEEIDLLHISQQSCYLFGRDRGVVDIPLDHLSCSKQHAVLQFRLIVERNEFGDEKRNIKPFILDLESANGTTVNSRDVPASRYYELKNGDTIRFAASERDWVLLCEDA